MVYNVERCFCDMGMGQNNLPLLNAKEVLTHSTLMHSKQKYFGAEIDWLTNMFILACSLSRLNLLHAASCRHGHGIIWGSGMNQHDKCVSKTCLDSPRFLRECGCSGLMKKHISCAFAFHLQKRHRMKTFGFLSKTHSASAMTGIGRLNAQKMMKCKFVIHVFICDRTKNANTNTFFCSTNESLFETM